MSSVVLEEEFDEDYEPTQEEILEYANFLGMDVEKEKDLFWIARESLKAPLPANWKPCKTDDGTVYYFNFVSGESLWDHPCDEHYRKMYESEKAKRNNVKKEAPKDSKTSSKSEPLKPSTLSSIKPATTAPITTTATFSKPILAKEDFGKSEAQEVQDDIEEDINSEDIIDDDDELVLKIDEKEEEELYKRLVSPPSKKDVLTDFEKSEISSNLSCKSSAKKLSLKPITKISAPEPSIQMTRTAKNDTKSDVSSQISLSEAQRKSSRDNLPSLKKTPVHSHSSINQPDQLIHHEAIKRKIAQETEAMERAERQVHEDKLKQLRTTHSRDLQDEESRLKTEFQQRIATIKAESEAEIVAARKQTAEYLNTLSAERLTAQKELEALKLKNKQELAFLQSEHKKNVERIRNESILEEEEERKNSQERITQIREDLTVQQASAQNDLQKANKTKTELDQELSLLKDELKSKHSALNDMKEKYEGFKQQYQDLNFQYDLKQKQLSVIVSELERKEAEIPDLMAQEKIRSIVAEQVKPPVEASVTVSPPPKILEAVSSDSALPIETAIKPRQQSISPTTSASNIARNQASKKNISSDGTFEVANKNLNVSEQTMIEGYGIGMKGDITDAIANSNEDKAMTFSPNSADKTILAGYSGQGATVPVTSMNVVKGSKHYNKASIEKVTRNARGGKFAEESMESVSSRAGSNDERAIYEALGGRSNNMHQLKRGRSSLANQSIQDPLWRNSSNALPATLISSERALMDGYGIALDTIPEILQQQSRRVTSTESNASLQNPLSAYLGVKFTASHSSITNSQNMDFQAISSSQRAFLNGYGILDAGTRNRETVASATALKSPRTSLHRGSSARKLDFTTVNSPNMETQEPPSHDTPIQHLSLPSSSSRSPSRATHLGTISRERSPRRRKVVGEEFYGHSRDGSIRLSKHSPGKSSKNNNGRSKHDYSPSNACESDSVSSTTSSSIDGDNQEEANEWTPSKQINRRLRREERNLRESKRALRKQAKTLQREETDHFYGVSQQRARMEELAARIDRENEVRKAITDDFNQQASRCQSLDAVEAEIEKVLSKLRSSRDTSVSRMQDMMLPPDAAKAIPSYSLSHSTTTPPFTTWSPSSYYSSPTKSVTKIGRSDTSETRKNAWNISRAKTERELDMHSHFLRQLVARKQSSLSGGPNGGIPGRKLY